MSYRRVLFVVRWRLPSGNEEVYVGLDWFLHDPKNVAGAKPVDDSDPPILEVPWEGFKNRFFDPYTIPLETDAQRFPFIARLYSDDGPTRRAREMLNEAGVDFAALDAVLFPQNTLERFFGGFTNFVLDAAKQGAKGRL